MNDITLRLLELYEHLKSLDYVKDKSGFAKTINVSASSLTEIWKKRSNAGMKIIQNTVKSFDFINSEWLLTGKGEMLKNNNNSNTQPNNSNCEKTIERMEKQLDRQEREIIQLTKFIDSLQRE
ncbi:MAG: hypothetical protein U9Q83_11190 [Bacteroidota bacterium]|nr:hypothetical protein [Bacteroidota bacterium]